MTAIILLITFSAKVFVITNRQYQPMVDSLIRAAKKEILVVMYSASDKKFQELLSDAAERGIKVKVILDASCWNPDNSQKNWKFSKGLKGVDIYFDDPFTTSHDKLIIIDGMTTIVGSHNWSYSAINFNNEASVVIISRRVASAFKRHFNKILKKSSHAR